MTNIGENNRCGLIVILQYIINYIYIIYIYIYYTVHTVIVLNKFTGYII